MRICSVCKKIHESKLINTCKTCYHRNWRKVNSEKNLEIKRKYYRKKHGIPLDDPFRKRKAGEGNIDSQGYKNITKRGHPNQMDKNGRIREHIYVMTQHLGRPLFKGETVHHLNGIRNDNRIENLELWSKSQPPGQRVKDKIKWYIEFLIQHGYKVEKA